MVSAFLVVAQYAVVASLLLVSAVVLVRTVDNFVRMTSTYPQSIPPAVDGILVVIILIDIVETIFHHLRDATLPVRPFLIIGILAGVRDILSASAHLTLSGTVGTHSFDQTLIELGVGVALVMSLLIGLVILDRSPHAESL